MKISPMQTALPFYTPMSHYLAPDTSLPSPDTQDSRRKDSKKQDSRTPPRGFSSRHIIAAAQEPLPGFEAWDRRPSQIRTDMKGLTMPQLLKLWYRARDLLSVPLGGLKRARIAMRMLYGAVRSGTCWMSVQYIAIGADVSTKTVFRTLSAFEGRGLLKRKQGATFDGHQSSNDYDLTGLVEYLVQLLDAQKNHRLYRLLKEDLHSDGTLQRRSRSTWQPRPGDGGVLVRGPAYAHLMRATA